MLLRLCYRREGNKYIKTAQDVWKYEVECINIYYHKIKWKL